MCGIFVALSRQQHVRPNQKISDLLQRRGPDSQHEVTVTVESLDRRVSTATDHDRNSASGPVYLTAFSTVLSLRGEQTVAQPVTEKRSQQHGLNDPLLCWNGEAWRFAGKPISGNDSEVVFQLLAHVSRSVTSSRPEAHENAIAEVLASLRGPYAFAFFVPTIKRLYFGRDMLGRRSLLYHITESGDIIISSVADPSIGTWTEIEADGIYWLDLDSRSPFVAKHVPYLRMTDGTDEHTVSTLPYLTLNRFSPPNDSTARKPLSPESSSVMILQRLLARSLSLRISTIPNIVCASAEIRPNRLAVLFSGGLDCTVLARMANDILPVNEPIDLLNVAFENPRVHAQAPVGESAYERCPDRITGRSSFLELQSVCPARHWRFVAIDIPYTETVSHRDSVMALMHPHNTEMDLSIASALYFAARGFGTIEVDGGGHAEHTSPARVLLSGLGADELFGGYTRHGTAFARRGYPGLIDELELDIERLGKRNLGRDDRVFAHWAREVRFPFLDEDLVKWALDCPVWDKCGFGESEVQTEINLEPSKKVLRCLAWKLGMVRVAHEKKRAIQFGARTAKMEAGRTKGTQLVT